MAESELDALDAFRAHSARWRQVTGWKQMSDKELINGLKARSTFASCDAYPFNKISARERIGLTCADHMMQMAAQRIKELTEVKRGGLLHAI